MLHLHRGERADLLAGALGELLSAAAEDPFAPEIICVPSRGVERWLTQQLSLVLGARSGLADGVCANVAFPSPGRVVADCVASISRIDARTDPWRPGRSVWPLLELIEADAGLLTGGIQREISIATAEGRSRQYAAARHVAELFDKYAVYRPAMISDWADGRDCDGAGSPLPADVQWQAALWRELRVLLGLPSTAERLAPACERLAAEPSALELPSRLSVFGLTRLPPSQLAVLAALAVHRDVHLWLLHPSAVLWDRLAASGVAAGGRRRDDPTALLATHRLLSSLGRDARELQLTLGAAPAATTVDSKPLVVARPTGKAMEPRALTTFQQTIRDDAPVAHEQRPLLADNDRSIQVHACHGRARQVDVVRDVILGLLAADPTLEPRDVIVMCPDIEAFAPLISATFGVAAELAAQEGDDTSTPASPAGLLRVRLADRSLRQTNPMMSAAATLLELVDSRLTASEVLDFAAAPPVRRRFDFDDDDLGRLAEWVAEAQVRWGLNAAHRAAFKLDGFPQNTWEAGLDRLLLGVAMAEGAAGGDAQAQPASGGWLGLALPLDDVDSSDIELVGRLAELVDRLAAAIRGLRGPQSLSAWIDQLIGALDSLTLTTGPHLWQTAQLRAELTDVVAAAGERAATVSLSLADLRNLLGDRLRGRPTRANFRTGSLTMCTLVPMRSVPHRVVCLLGLDDGAFPRQPAADGDDILLRDPLTGERDERSEDRQLLLDAILSARDHLVITYTGADPRTNAARPPAVPVGELLDALDAGFRTADETPVRQRLLIRHPLQPFDPRNFTPDGLGSPQPFSFDPAALGGAIAVSAPRRSPPPFLDRPLRPSPAGDLELETLRGFYEHPVRGFLRQRLGVVLPRSSEETSDQLPVEVKSLARWQIGQRMLDARLSGLDPAQCRQAEWRRGALPPGRLGTGVLNGIADEVEEIISETRGWHQSPAQSRDLAVELPGGRRVTGTVGGLCDTTLVHTSFGKVNNKRRFRAWLTLLLLAAANPQERFQAVAVGRQSQMLLGPLEPAEAVDRLWDLVAMHDLGLRAPLPVASKTSFEYASARRRGAPPDEAVKVAAKEWENRRGWGEAADAEHAQVFGPAPPFAALWAPPPQPDDGAELWPLEPTRFAVLSRRWWDPMLEAEQQR